tara:strand:- start:6805 stop:7827 length:1023 start_codon:yes stop_codon:yes gene_type:complete
MSKYNVGLGNVGSYQSSGKPWLKTVASLADTGTTYLEFPNVTKKVRVKNYSDAGSIHAGFADNVRRAYDMPDSTGKLECTFTSSSAFTISFWLKPGPGVGTVTRVLELDGGLSNTRLQGHGGNGAIKLFINNNPQSSLDHMTAPNTWSQITVVINGTDNKVYVNGVLAFTNTTAAGAFTGFTIGADSTNFDDVYDEMYLFNTAFTEAEAIELYAAGAYFDPRDHSQAANLVSWWAFEDNANRAYFTTNDTITTINDRIGSNNLTKGGGGTGAFVNGRQLDTAVNHHSIIIPAGSEVELDVRTKSMFLYASGSTQTFDVYASLTNIPSERMYDLTGAGIDV